MYLFDTKILFLNKQLLNSVDVSPAIEVTLLAPPASGETMMLLRHSGMFSLIHLRTAGSAYKLSTGMSKKP